jgi:hypothetical protein
MMNLSKDDNPQFRRMIIRDALLIGLIFIASGAIFFVIPLLAYLRYQ